MAHPIVHFEIPADDPKKIVRFYERVFGWKTSTFDGPPPYWTIQTSDDPNALGGGIVKKAGPTHTPINYVLVDSVDAHAKRIVDAGGRIVNAKQAVPSMGWYAIAVDPEGNAFGLWQPDPSATAS